MSVSNTTKEFNSPIIDYSGTKYYDQGSKYKAEDFLEKRAVLPEDSLVPLFAKKSKFAFFKNKTPSSPLAPSILPAKSIAFFAGHPQSDFNPYKADKHHPVHQQLKKIVDHFEIFSKGLSLNEKITAAEQIISEIRMAKTIKYTKEKYTKEKPSMEEMHIQAQKALDEPPMSFEALKESLEKDNDDPFSIVNAEMMASDKSEKDHSTATLFEIGARYYLSCSLFKTQSEKPQTKTGDVAAIYNFMTKDNTFMPHWGGMRLAMHPNLLGRIGANIADLLTVTDTDSALVQASKLVDFYVNKLKNSINKGIRQDTVYLEGESGLRTRTVQTKAIDIFLKSAEMTYRHALAQKVVSSLAKSYKVVYQKSGELPEGIAQTSAKITAFLQPSTEPAAIQRALHAPCHPVKDLLSQIFGRPQDEHALIEQVEREAQKQHDRTNSWIRFLPFIHTLSHDKIESIKQSKIAAIRCIKNL